MVGPDSGNAGDEGQPSQGHNGSLVFLGMVAIIAGVMVGFAYATSDGAILNGLFASSSLQSPQAKDGPSVDTESSNTAIVQTDETPADNASENVQPIDENVADGIRVSDSVEVQKTSPQQVFINDDGNSSDLSGQENAEQIQHPVSAPRIVSSGDSNAQDDDPTQASSVAPAEARLSENDGGKEEEEEEEELQKTNRPGSEGQDSGREVSEDNEMEVIENELAKMEDEEDTDELFEILRELVPSLREKLSDSSNNAIINFLDDDDDNRSENDGKDRDSKDKDESKDQKEDNRGRGNALDRLFEDDGQRDDDDD